MKKNLRVLLVVNNDIDAGLIENELSQGGFKPVCERIQSAGMLIEKTSKSKWDLIVSDISSPQFDASQAIDFLNERNISVPFIAVSDDCREDIIVRLVKAGAWDFISSKNLEKLPASVRDLLNVSRLEKKPAPTNGNNSDTDFDDLMVSGNRQSKAINRSLESTEKMLNISESRYQTLFDQAPNGIFFATRDGILIDANQSYASMLGYDSPEDAISNIKDLALDFDTDPNVRYELVKKLNKYNETVRTETRFKRKDGSEIYVNVTLKLISDDNSTDYIIGQVVDVTNLRNAQKSLQETEARFRNVIKNVPISVFNQDRNLVYTWIFNPKVENAPDIVLGKTDYDLFTPDQAQRLMDMKRKVLETGRPERGLIVIDYEGNEVYVDLTVDPIIDESGSVTGVTGVSLDLTDKIKSDEALRLSERHYRELVESANSIILRWLPDGTVKYMNDFGLTFFGYEAHELIGKSVNVLVPDRDKSGHDLSSLINEILKNTDSYRYNENDNVLRSGEIVTVSWSNRAITDDQGNVIEILAIGNDITDLKKKEDELKLLNEKLEIKVQERTVELEATVDDLIAEVSERIRIQEELRAKEEEFRSLVEFSPDIIIKFDSEGRYVYVNPRHALEMGVRDEDVLGRTVFEAGMPPERANEWQETIMGVFASGLTAELEGPYDSSEGVKWFFSKFSPVKDDSGKVISVIAVLRNITEIINIREEIRSKEELYRALIENTPDIVSVCDRHLKYSFVNSAMERSLGINPADIIGKSNSEINADNENIATWETNLKWVFKHKKNKSFELPYKFTTGVKWFYVIFVPLFDNHGKVEHVLTISRDIDDLKQKEFELKRHKDNLEEIVAERTEDLKLANEKLIAEINERKLVESRLRLSEERFRIALQNAPISVLSQDTNLNINWMYNSRFGFDTTEIIGKSDFDLFEKADAEILNELKQKVISSGKPKRQELIITFGGQKHYLDMTVEPVFDYDGVLSGIITASIDITNTRLKEDELRIKDAAIKSSINGIAISDLEGKVTYANQACLEIWGYDNSEEVVGQSLFKFIDLNKGSKAMPPYADVDGKGALSEETNFEEKLQGVIETLSSDKGWIGEISAIKKDGSSITVQTSANIVLDDKGRPICMMASFIDATDKKKMEEALRESERRYRILFEQAPNGIFLSTIEGSILDLNPAYARMLGYKNPDEALRLIKNVATDVYLDPERRFEIIEMVKQSPDYVRSEARYKTRDGRIIDVMLTIKSILNPNGRPAYLIGHAEDITELKNAEKNRSLLSAIVESSGNAIISSDLEGNIMSWNKAAEMMYGYSMDEITGKSVFELIPEDKKSELAGFLEKMKNGGMIDQYESLRKRKDGSLIPVSVIDSPVVDNMNRIIGFSFIAQDLTPIKKAESAYKESMDRLRIALQYTPITIFSQDLDIRTTWVYNPPFGLSADEIIGRTDLELFRQDEAQAMMDFKRQAIETGLPAREEVTISYNDVKHHFDLTVEPMIDGWGSVTGITCALIDITEKKEHEQERQRQEIAQVLEKSARLASVGVLAGGITHEINQPLNAIRMGSDGILLWNKRNKSVLPDIITDMLVGVSNACKRIEEIILNMRSLWSGLHQENMQTININESAQRAVSLLIQKLHNHGIGFEIKLSEESLYILANLLQIELIINNLVVNSIYSVDKARSKGKSIILETNGDERYVYLSVRDNGLGLPDVHLDKLFDPFFTTKPPEEGSGLGLAIVKMFVNRFEGKIDAYNNEEGGATFAIRFPRKKLME